MGSPICRTCLKEDPHVPLFTTHTETEICFSKMLNYCASIRVEMEDGLPSQICQICANSLVAFYNFKKTAIESDLKLRQTLISPETEMKNESEEHNLKQSIKREPSPLPRSEEDNEQVFPLVVEVKNELEDCQTSEPQSIDPVPKIKKPHQCDVCGRCFRDRNSLGRHYMVHTGEKPFECDLCNRKFNRLEHLKAHRRTHTGERPHKCTVCSKTFTQHSSLYTHVRTHSGERPHVCTICGKSFTQSNSLTLHKRIHTGETPYKCTLCDKAFANSGNLNVHMRFHKNERRFSCDVCGMTFVAASHLGAHVKTHDTIRKKNYTKDERPFQCNICLKRYVDDGLLTMHMKRHRLV